MKKTEARKILGNIEKDPSKEKLDQIYDEFRDFYYPLFFDSRPSERSQAYKMALADKFIEGNKAEKFIYNDHTYAFLMFGNICEAYHTLSGSNEWEHLTITYDIDDYKQYKRNYAPKTAWHRFVDIAEKISHIGAMLLLLFFVNLFFYLKGGFFETLQFIYLGGILLSWILTLIAIPLDVLLFIPRNIWQRIKSERNFFRLVFGGVFHLIFLCIKFVLFPSAIFIYKEKRLREEPQYEKYKEERIDNRYKKTMSEINKYFPKEESKLRAFSNAVRYINVKPNEYTPAILRYMDDIRSERHVWLSIFNDTEYDDQELSEKSAKMERKHDRQARRDEWAAFDCVEIDGVMFTNYDEHYVDAKEEEREKERTELQNEIDKLKQIRQFQSHRLQAEAIARFGIYYC